MFLLENLPVTDGARHMADSPGDIAEIPVASRQRRSRIKLILGTTVETDAEINAASGGKPDLVIGADGVWSKFRKTIAGAGTPEFSDMVAWRFIIPERDVPAFINTDNVTAYLGPSAHFITYPLKEAGFMKSGSPFRRQKSRRNLVGGMQPGPQGRDDQPVFMLAQGYSRPFILCAETDMVAPFQGQTGSLD